MLIWEKLPGHHGRNAFLKSGHSSANFSTEKITPGEWIGIARHIPAFGMTAMWQEGLHPSLYPGELVVRDAVLATRLLDQQFTVPKGPWGPCSAQQLCHVQLSAQQSHLRFNI